MEKQTNPLDDSFGKFIQRVVKKLAPNAAFDLGRDARFRAIENILIEKKICTQEELSERTDKELDRMAEVIEKMPPPPIRSPFSFPPKE